MACAGILYDMGGQHREAAATVVMQLIHRDETNPDAQFHYARLALDRGMLRDGLRVLLRLLVLQPTDTDVRWGARSCRVRCML